jgi:hypothetical protein
MQWYGVTFAKRWGLVLACVDLRCVESSSMRVCAGVFHQGASRRLRVTADSEQYPDTDTLTHALPADALEKGPYKRHLVLAVDNLAKASEEACDWLLEQVCREGDLVHLLHVVSFPPSATSSLAPATLVHTRARQNHSYPSCTHTFLAGPL